MSETKSVENLIGATWRLWRVAVALSGVDPQATVSAESLAGLERAWEEMVRLTEKASASKYGVQPDLWLRV